MPQVIYDITPDFYIGKDAGKLAMHNMHYHRSYELYYCFRGEREYFIGDEFYRIGEGDIVLIPEETIHRTAGKWATRFLIYFSDTFLRRFFSEDMISALHISDTLVFHPDDELRDRIEAELNAMLGEYSEGSEENFPSLASRLARLLLDIAAAPKSYVPYSDRRIAQIVRYINDHYSEINDIQQIADHFFLSKYHLCRIFSKNLGISLISYLNTIKVRVAAELMKNEKLKLTDIATHCGFNSSSYLCKVFRAEKGVSPTVYRKNLKGK